MAQNGYAALLAGTALSGSSLAITFQTEAASSQAVRAAYSGDPQRLPGATCLRERKQQSTPRSIFRASSQTASGGMMEFAAM
jgi:hypothetical protein